MNEEATIASARQGDVRAFNQLVLSYQTIAYNVAYRILGDVDSAADATQEAFISAYQAIGQFRGEALYVFRFLFQKTFRDQHGEVGVLVSRFLEQTVQCGFHLLPQRETPGTDDHAALYRRVVGQFGLDDGIHVPLGVVFPSGGDAFSHGVYR